ncbi:hypothetical protein NDU88_007452 [Pleurodeles waltl]|uniref:Uncharacterized protein n=1 Tax=Pleurodeles waltl TaxID=8319 RepID=A0AAV7PLB1_PLEWA|nr:hypothetical protein NDU88_007452 [Pleurodeles waltl]
MSSPLIVISLLKKRSWSSGGETTQQASFQLLACRSSPRYIRTPLPQFRRDNMDELSVSHRAYITTKGLARLIKQLFRMLVLPSRIHAPIFTPFEASIVKQLMH